MQGAMWANVPGCAVAEVLTARSLALPLALADSCARRLGVTASSSDASSLSLLKEAEVASSRYSVSLAALDVSSAVQ
jgi:hypothetical protein